MVKDCGGCAPHWYQLHGCRKCRNPKKAVDNPPPKKPRSAKKQDKADDSEEANVSEQSREDGVKKCPKCEYPMTNITPHEKGETWFCPRCSHGGII